MWIFFLFLILVTIFTAMIWIYHKQERSWQEELSAYRNQNSGTPTQTESDIPEAVHHHAFIHATETHIQPEQEETSQAVADPLLDAPRRPVRLPMPKPVSESEARQTVERKNTPLSTNHTQSDIPEWEMRLSALQYERLPTYPNRKPAPKPLGHLNQHTHIHSTEAEEKQSDASDHQSTTDNVIPFQLLEETPPEPQEEPEIITLEEATRNLRPYLAAEHDDDETSNTEEQTEHTSDASSVVQPDLEVITIDEALRSWQKQRKEPIVAPSPLADEAEEIGLDEIEETMMAVRERSLSKTEHPPQPQKPLANDIEIIGMDEIRDSLLRQRQAQRYQRMADSPNDSLSIIREDEVFANLAHTDSPINRRRKAQRTTPPTPPQDNLQIPAFRRAEKQNQPKNHTRVQTTMATSTPPESQPARTEQDADGSSSVPDDSMATLLPKQPSAAHHQFNSYSAQPVSAVEIKAPPIIEQSFDFPEPLVPDPDFSQQLSPQNDWSAFDGFHDNIEGITKQTTLQNENNKLPIDNDTYPLPPLELLLPPQYNSAAVQSDEQLLENGITIEEKLAEFKVKVRVIDSFAGPVITRYEIEPDVGVRGNSVINLEKDLARSLGMASIRVVETIPGKNCMGIELPNPKRQIIRLSEILNARQFTESQSKLTLALGQDITGQPVVTDLAKAPHLLVAGTTGSGKSVGINSMILSMLFKASPEDVRLIMIDPKMLELSVYEGIPHLLAPVVTDMKLAANALNWCVSEMEKRYRLMSHLGVRNLESFNQKITEATLDGQTLTNPFSLSTDDPEPLQKLPAIVVIVDEFADLMMTAGKKIEELIARLAQKARAAGIHLILATQRPSVDVITGLIKANIPTRIAFQVPTKTDSRTILDQIGAENLLGQGDMLFLPPGTNYLQRVHGAFVADSEVHHVVEYLKQFDAPAYIDDILSSTDDNIDSIIGRHIGEKDPLFDKAVETLLRTQKPTISSLQRYLRIGYNKAATLFDQMEAEGIVSASDHAGKRTILARSEHSDDAV